MTVKSYLEVKLFLGAVALLKIVGANIINNNVETEDAIHHNCANHDEVQNTVRRWAPLVLLAPGERFLPSSVPFFLQNTAAGYLDQNNKSILSMTQDLPNGHDSEKYFLYTRQTVENLLTNQTSFLYGQNPSLTPVPVYAVIKRCTNTNLATKYRTWYSKRRKAIANRPNTAFHVTYWIFYPFNEGKNVCTVSLGVLGPVPIPKLFNKCLGEQQYVGNHIGDWEHVSLYFKKVGSPDRMYVSTHDAGVYYKFDPILNIFTYEKQETRKGILQKPRFPINVYMLHGRPLLYSAKGSHGLWSKPGKHRYLTVPRLYDETGNGIPWKTWENLEIVDPPYTVTSKWLKFRGRWGNSKCYCHPLNKVGIDICQLSDGPTGIPLKRPNFVCPSAESII